MSHRCSYYHTTFLCMSHRCSYYHTAMFNPMRCPVLIYEGSLLALLREKKCSERGSSEPVITSCGSNACRVISDEILVVWTYLCCYLHTKTGAVYVSSRLHVRYTRSILKHLCPISILKHLDTSSILKQVLCVLRPASPAAPSAPIY